VQTGAAKEYFGAVAMVPYNAYLAIKHVDETCQYLGAERQCLPGRCRGVVGCTVSAHQQRVLDEKQELDIRITKLDELIQRNALFRQLGSDEQSRMRRQLDVMREYAVILGERISAF